MKKRVISLILTICIFLSLGTVALADSEHEYWKSWSQADERWGELSISSVGNPQNNMKWEGCLITAFTKIFIYSGQQDPEDFTPADCLEVMLEYGMLSEGGALMSGLRMNTNGMLAAWAPELTYIPGSVHAPWDQETACDRISEAIDAKQYVVIRAHNYATGNSHYMAVDRVENGTVYVMDNNAVIDLYADNNYGGVAQTLYFQYEGKLPYPARNPVSQPLPPSPESGSGNTEGGGNEETQPPQSDGWTSIPKKDLLRNFKQVAQYEYGLYDDVPKDTWFHDGVARAYEVGLMQGIGNDLFGTGDKFSVAAAITVAARLHSIYYTGSANFKQEGIWYNVYVNYALANGIIEADQFDNYNRAATRAEMAQLMSAALPNSALKPINSIEIGSILDVGLKKDFAGDVYRLYMAGILTGSDDMHRFYPSNSISREEVATIISRIAILPLRQSFTMTLPFSTIDTDAISETEIIEYEELAPLETLPAETSPAEALPAETSPTETADEALPTDIESDIAA